MARNRNECSSAPCCQPRPADPDTVFFFILCLALMMRSMQMVLFSNNYVGLCSFFFLKMRKHLYKGIFPHSLPHILSPYILAIFLTPASSILCTCFHFILMLVASHVCSLHSLWHYYVLDEINVSQIRSWDSTYRFPGSLAPSTIRPFRIPTKKGCSIA